MHPLSPKFRTSANWLLVLSLLTSLFAGIAAPTPTLAAPATQDDGPASVSVAGSFNAEIGCTDDWLPDCAEAELVYDATDDVWQAEFELPAGDYEYKAALDDAWDENYGAGATRDGDNIALSLAEPTTVKFYYDHKSNWVTDNVNSVIATAPGSYNSEVGCPDDWQPECLRTWLQDVDGDGVYVYTANDLPAGDYELKVALREAWDESYGDADNNNIPFTIIEDGSLLVSFDTSDNSVSVATDAVGEPVVPGELPDVETRAALVQPTARHPIQDEVFYFVMPDRFANGDPSNDAGGLEGDRLVTGLDPTDKGFFHGGDLAGLIEQLDYLEGLGITAIWMTPVFKNNPVQGSGDDISAGYHGYWITDFTQFDPHFGTNEELEQLIEAAAERDIEIFFDIITNHTADILKYDQGNYSYVPKDEQPYRDAEGNAFDDRDFVGADTFPDLDPQTSFPYMPVFPREEDATLKVPTWLNNPIYYHNRGDTSFTGENSLYGDFFGLDDLFTEHPDVVEGMIDIFTFWVENYDIAGFRIDTVKHVNPEFWEAFSTAINEAAAAKGDDDFFIFGEVFSGNPELLSFYPTSTDMPAVLDFRFQEAVRGYVAAGGSADDMRVLFENDDYFTDADSSAYMLPTFIGNHDRGRFAWFVTQDTPGLSEENQLARTELAHALMYFARGVPVVYYGDEQGFVGSGGDKDARQDMFPSQVAQYNDEDLLGTDATTADANFDTAHPLYTALADFAEVYNAIPALQTGTQIHLYSEDGPGIYAFARLDREMREPYIVAVNNTAAAQTATVPVLGLSDIRFTPIYPETPTSLLSDADGNLEITVPPFGVLILRAEGFLDGPSTDASIGITTLTDSQVVSLTVQNLDGNAVLDRIEVGAEVASDVPVEVTFAVRRAGEEAYTPIGTDDNAPYRVFYETQYLLGNQTNVEEALDFIAIINDGEAYPAAQVTNVQPVVTEEPDEAVGDGDYPYAVVHYARSDGDYGDETSDDFNDYWGLHLWGDALAEGEATEWPNPKPFLGEDDYGRFAWITLQDSSQDVNFIVHRGDSKDGTEDDRSFNPNGDGPEIWLKQDDGEFYTSQAAAQGYVTIHYQRADGDYGDFDSDDYNDFWGLHAFGDALDDGLTVEYTSPLKPDGTDDFGIFWQVPVDDVDAQLGYIIHRGDTKSPNEDDQFLTPSETPATWAVAEDGVIYDSLGAATNTATIHYHRPDGDYGDYDSDDFNNYWSLYTWTGAANPAPSWQESFKPTGFDKFGPFWDVALEEGATQLNYILHRGDEKDPGPDQLLDTMSEAHEVWQLQGADPADPYLLPIEISDGPRAGGNISQASAHWVRENVILWDVEVPEGATVALYHDAEGGITQDNLSESDSIALTLNPDALTEEIAEDMPHLAGYPAFTFEADRDAIEEIFKGQHLVAIVQDGTVVDATRLQIPGVLDDLYTFNGDLGLTFVRVESSDGSVVSTPNVLRLWAPTARSVNVHLFDSPEAEEPFQVTPMTWDATSGTWSTQGNGTWVNNYYLYEVEVYVPSTGQVENNMVTDPYAFGLSTNSQRVLIVDLNNPDLMPEGWTELARPPLAAPTDASLYELHMRDFSADDPTVPEEFRGKYKAFTVTDSNGMQHLRALSAAGLNHLHLLPVFDIATINEDASERVEPNIPEDAGPASEEQAEAVEQVRDQDAFNWGYDPYHYTVPEGSYSTNPDDTTRIVEFREMVMALNNIGLRVVMDVVYNHTNAAGQDERSVLDKIVPGYYHRLDEIGNVATSTCCPNTATEHAMMEKLMIDSVVTWATQYKVDGFRFDLMGHHMKEDMLDVRAALDEVDPSIYLYGEGWNFGEVADGARGENATQLNMAGTGIGTFNDRLRDAARGGGPFDGGLALIENQGFLNGLYVYPNASNDASEDELADLLLSADQIRVGLAGNLADYEFEAADGTVKAGSEIDYNGSPAGYTASPQEHIVYVSAHDNQTLFDINVWKLPTDATPEQRIAAQNLGIDLTVLAQGVPFLHAGVDLMRSKSLERDSYNSGDWFNRLFFDRSFNNFGVGIPVEAGDDAELMVPFLQNESSQMGEAEISQTAEHLQQMLAVRYSSPLFRLQTAEEVQARVRFHNTGPNQVPGVIIMSISDNLDVAEVGAAQAEDLDPEREFIVVAFNANPEAVEISVAALDGLPLVPNALMEDETSSRFDDTSGTLTLPAYGTAVFEQPAAPTALDETAEPLDPSQVTNRLFLPAVGN